MEVTVENSKMYIFYSFLLFVWFIKKQVFFLCIATGKLNSCQTVCQLLLLVKKIQSKNFK